MATEPLIKRPGESRLYAVNFGFQPEIRDTGEALSGTPTVSSTPSGLTIGSPTISAAKVQFRISGGTDGIDYTLTVTTTTSGGNTLVETVTLKVRAAS